MPTSTLKPGDTVVFSQSLLRRLNDPKVDQARGTVVSVRDRIAEVDFHGTWIAHQDGGTVRTLPAANLSRVMSNGLVLRD